MPWQIFEIKKIKTQIAVATNGRNYKEFEDNPGFVKIGYVLHNHLVALHRANVHNQSWKEKLD